MLNIDTIRALQNTILSEIYRSLFRYIPVFIFAIILIQYNQQPYLVEAYLLGFVLLSVFSGIKVLNMLASLKKPNDNSEKFSIKDIFKTSAPMALSAIAYFIMQSIDIIILSIYEGFDQIAYYSVSVKLAMVTTLALDPIGVALPPNPAPRANAQNRGAISMVGSASPIAMITGIIAAVNGMLSTIALAMADIQITATASMTWLEPNSQKIHSAKSLR